MAIGLDGLMHYYEVENSPDEIELVELAKSAISQLPNVHPYATTASIELVNKFASLGMRGITVTATGFYGPQGRAVIASPKSKSFLDDMGSIKLKDLQVTNLEMETAGIYGMATLLGHRAISINAILANRIHQTFSKKPGEVVNQLIEDVLKLISVD